MDEGGGSIDICVEVTQGTIISNSVVQLVSESTSTTGNIHINIV